MAAAGRMVARGFYWGVASFPTTTDSLERCLAIERRFGVQSSYFFAVFPPAARSPYDCVYRLDDRCQFRGRRYRVSEVVKLLSDEGHDIGLHGSYQSAVLEGALSLERERLETASGLTVSTTRQHYLHWDIRKTPRFQEQAGLTADSTLGFNRNVGFRSGTSLPHRLFDLERGRVMNVLEVPLVIQEGALMGANALELSVPQGQSVITRIMDSVAAVGGLVTVLFHPHSFVRSEYVQLYEWCIQQAVERNAWVTSVRGLDLWWRERDRRLGLRWQ
jgi:hypothetical protein